MNYYFQIRKHIRQLQQANHLAIRHIIIYFFYVVVVGIDWRYITALWWTGVRFQILLTLRFEQNKISISEILTKYNFKFQVSPFSGVTHNRCNARKFLYRPDFRKMSSCDIYKNYVCFCLFVCLLSKVVVIFSSLITWINSSFSIWIKLFMGPRTLRPVTRKCEKGSPWHFSNIPQYRHVFVLVSIRASKPICCFERFLKM